MTKEISEMTKSELIQVIEEQNQIILDLQVKLEKSTNNRKSQVLELLESNSSISILEISQQLDISTKNVSSQLTYLRNDGYKIFTDNNGRKVLMK